MKPIDFNQWTDPTDFERNELVFEKRNKAYGAYLIRKNYNQTLIRSLALSVFFIVGLLLIPKIGQLWAKDDLEPLWSSTVVFINPDNLVKKIEDPLPEEKTKKTDTKKDIALQNVYKKIVDGKTEGDSLTMDDMNKLKTGVTHNPNGTDSTDELFIEIGDLDSGNQIVVTKIESPILAPDKMPEFDGGNDNIPPYLGSNTQYPEDAIRDGIEARVMVGFVVEKDGSISNIKILSCTQKGFGFEKEAIRVISSMPHWKPSMQNGHPVRVFFNVPLNFRLM